MEIDQHMGHHDEAADLPLLTGSATVTAVEPMDRSRNDAVLRAVRRQLAECGRGDLLETARRGARVDWDRICGAIDDPDRVEAIAALGDRYDRAYPSLLRVRLATDEPFEFVPGQYVTITYERTPRPYSIASTPEAGDIELCLGRVPGGELTTDVFERLRPGDELTVRGPNGELVLNEPSRRDVVFLATGTGVAPFKGMIDYLFEQGWDAVDGHQRDVWLFLGAGWADDLPYREHFRTLASRHRNFRFVPTCSREALLSDWQGETAYVQRVLAKYLREDALAGVDLPEPLAAAAASGPVTDVDARIDPETVELYACGVNAMVHQLLTACDALGVPADCIAAEGFG